MSEATKAIADLLRRIHELEVERDGLAEENARLRQAIEAYSEQVELETVQMRLDG